MISGKLDVIFRMLPGINTIILENAEYDRLEDELLAIQRFGASGPVIKGLGFNRIEYLGREIKNVNEYQSILQRIREDK